MLNGVLDASPVVTGSIEIQSCDDVLLQQVSYVFLVFLRQERSPKPGGADRIRLIEYQLPAQVVARQRHRKCETQHQSDQRKQRGLNGVDLVTLLLITSGAENLRIPNPQLVRTGKDDDQNGEQQCGMVD